MTEHRIARSFDVAAYAVRDGVTVESGTRPFEITLNDALLQMFYDNEDTFFDDGVDRLEYETWLEEVAPWAREAGGALYDEFGERYHATFDADDPDRAGEAVLAEVEARIAAVIAEHAT